MSENDGLTVGELLDLIEKLEVSRETRIYVERESFGDDETYPAECPGATVEVMTTGYQRVVFHIP